MSRAAAALVALGLVAASPASGWASGIELRLGGFFPRADANLFADVNELYTPDHRADECTVNFCPGVQRSDWDGLYGGGEYSLNLSRHVELAFSVDGYGQEIHSSYRDSVRDDGSEIQQTLQLTIVPVGVSFRFLPLDRRAAVQPYLTVGGDVFYYRYEEFGDFIDFFDDTRPISYDSFLSDGVIFGGHAAAGLRVPVGDDFAITGEVRYQLAGRKQMDDDFSRNQIDISGTSATIGVRLRF
jgi:hypothetical protein